MTDYNSYYGQTYDTVSIDPAVFVVPMIIGLVLGILTIVGMWKVFSKAGVPGWGSNYSILQHVLIIQNYNG